MQPKTTQNRHLPMPVSFHFISLSNRCSAQHSAAQQNRVNIQLLIQQEHIRQLARLERAVIVLNADSARRIGGRGMNRLTERNTHFNSRAHAVHQIGAVHLPEDEISSPTSAEALAGFIDCLMHSREYGLFHASCDGSCSRAEYAREILRLAGKENVPVTSASENTALRPRFTLLDNMMLRITGLYQMPDWHDALSEYMSHRQTGVNK